MASTTELLTLPSRQPNGEDAIRTITRALAQSLEDLRLAERIQQVLQGTGYPSLRAVAITVRGRLVTLQGCVPSYYMKQLAQEYVLTISGIRGLCNELTVVRSDSADAPPWFSRWHRR